MTIQFEYEYRTMDKSFWDDGPWHDEPDKAQWTDAAPGLPCLIVRAMTGALCGYVGITEEHPLYGWDYAEDRVTDIEHECRRNVHSPECILRAHLGITFSGFCQEGDEQSTICHIPKPGEPEHVFWFGFHTAHHGDRMPQFEALTPLPFEPAPGIYRDMSYVQQECARLAEQLAAIGAASRTKVGA